MALQSTLVGTGGTGATANAIRQALAAQTRQASPIPRDPGFGGSQLGGFLNTVPASKPPVLGGTGFTIESPTRPGFTTTGHPISNSNTGLGVLQDLIAGGHPPTGGIPIRREPFPTVPNTNIADRVQPLLQQKLATTAAATRNPILSGFLGQGFNRPPATPTQRPKFTETPRGKEIFGRIQNLFADLETRLQFQPELFGAFANIRDRFKTRFGDI